MTRPNPAVIGHIQGGLGNQLFCYAAARALSLRAGLPLRLNTTAGYRNEKYGRNLLLRFFNLDLTEAGAAEAYMNLFGRARRSRAAKKDAHKPLDQRRVIQEPKDQQFLPELCALQPKQSIYLKGYWQNEAYFADAADTLRDDFQLRESAPIDPDPTLAALAQAPSTVSVHIRSYGEVVNPAPSLVLNEHYYAPAIDAIAEHVPDARLLVFSDDSAWAKSIIDATDHADRATYVPNTHTDPTTATLTDFSLMKRCQHHVVGNSSFSWWTAWLGEREGSRIVAPPTGLPGHGGGFPQRWLSLLQK